MRLVLAPNGVSVRTLLLLRQETSRRLVPCLLVAVLGLTALSPVISFLWRVWTTDALRSVGMLFPMISAILTLQAWRRLGWETRGTWWGLAPLVYAVTVAHAANNTFVRFALGSHVSFSLLPMGSILFGYASGIILLFGGVRVWRRALFPLSLLLLVNPVPQFFLSFVDLPLQYMSARTTRAFAAAIGIYPDGNQLRLMFAPEFGMFIAPGCNGIRGAMTMGYLSLIMGYIYSFSIRLRIFAVACALALGYAFNLIRLCALVIYYWVALRLHPLQAHSEAADYVIGAVLFILATGFFVALIQWKGKTGHEQRVSEADAAFSDRKSLSSNEPLRWKWLISLAIIAMTGGPYIYGYGGLVANGIGRDGNLPNASDLFPAQMGNYRLFSTRDERDGANKLIYDWGSYSNVDKSSEVEVGLWFPSGIHQPSFCHIARGEKPVWSDVRTLPIGGGTGTFQLTAYQDGGAYLLEASSICTPIGCYEKDYAPSHTGFSFGSVGVYNFLFPFSFRSRPILIRLQSEGSPSSVQGEAPRKILELQNFISNLKTSDLDRFANSREIEVPGPF